MTVTSCTHGSSINPVRYRALRSASSTSRLLSRHRRSSSSEFERAACAAPTCISQPATCHRTSDVVPGHEVVGVVEAAGSGTSRFAVGERVGIAWLRHTCGRCRWCRRGQENLCVSPRFTGWDTDGGYAERAVIDEAYAYRLPTSYDDEHAAPLLCAGIIGYRALRLASLPPGGRLGIYGFGASAHITAQIALAQGARVHVLTRSPEARELALELGAHSAGPGAGSPPELLDSAILFAPAGDLVPPALEALDRGGTLAVAGIHLSEYPSVSGLSTLKPRAV